VARPLRVLELLVSTDLGGGPAQVREVVARLPREEFAVTVAGPAGGAHGGVFVESGARVVGIGTDRIGPRAFLDVLQLIRLEGIDIVHSHGKGADSTDGSPPAARASRPCIPFTAFTRAIPWAGGEPT